VRHPASGGAGASAAWVTMVLSHGAGGGIDAPDLVAVAAGLPAYGVDVVLVEQPWRAAGRRLAPRPDRLDAAFEAVVAHLAPATPFVVGGRSAGARVACRTGAGLGAVGVLALAFPLRPPGRPQQARTAELIAAGLPTLVVQGARDPFGSAADVRAAIAAQPLRGPDPDIRIVAVAGADHGFAVRVRDGGTAARDHALGGALMDVRAFLGVVAGPNRAGNT